MDKFSIFVCHPWVTDGLAWKPVPCWKLQHNAESAAFLTQIGACDFFLFYPRVLFKIRVFLSKWINIFFLCYVFLRNTKFKFSKTLCSFLFSVLKFIIMIIISAFVVSGSDMLRLAFTKSTFHWFGVNKIPKSILKNHTVLWVIFIRV